ncbi:glycoside hydrolase/deacetylase [Auricularia subglabra TFB-10046 SS5]|nr:glycoside hydrolase/deacetylase [Auricularia subglabra TFB-10046 SS5]
MHLAVTLVSSLLVLSGAFAHPHPYAPAGSKDPQSIIRRAVPLSDINEHLTTIPDAVQLTSTYEPGARPTGISGAPALPPLHDFHPEEFPPWDRVPPTDTPEVQEWVRQVKESGVDVPGFGRTMLDPDGGSLCAANVDAARDADARCWWTCNQCTRDEDVSACQEQLTWGLTFDDGPSPWTPKLLEYLDEQELKATFFVVGSRVMEYPEILQAEHMQGHHVAVHTWSHSSLTTLTNEQLVAEFGWTKKAIKDVLGVTPLYFRPPYGDIDDRVRAIARAMGLTAIMWTTNHGRAFDTEDWQIPGGMVNGDDVVSNFKEILETAPTLDTGFIVLEHDLYPQTVEIAAGYIIPEALSFEPKLKVQSVMTCMGQSLGEAYVETNRNHNNAAAEALNLLTPAPTGTSIVNGTYSGGTRLPSETGASQAVNAAPVKSEASFALMLAVSISLFALQA